VLDGPFAFFCNFHKHAKPWSRNPNVLIVGEFQVPLTIPCHFSNNEPAFVIYMSMNAHKTERSLLSFLQSNAMFQQWKLFQLDSEIINYNKYITQNQEM
jgi:hypothetical protein